MNSVFNLTEKATWLSDGVFSNQTTNSHLRISIVYFINVVKKIREKNCALFIWCTMPCLPDVFKVIESLGFKYKTCAFTWIKTRKDGQPLSGMGNYTKANAELCLLAMRGHI